MLLQRLPKWGMTANGELWRLPTLVPPISGIGGGVWPTPNVPNGGRVIPEGAAWSGKAAYLSDGRKVQVTLAEVVKRKEDGTPYQTQTTGMLNPAWVESLQGYPAGWTELDPSPSGPADPVKPSTTGKRRARPAKSPTDQVG